MIISNKYNRYRCNSRPINATVLLYRRGIMVRLKYEPFAAGQAYGKLPLSVTYQRMRISQWR